MKPLIAIDPGKSGGVAWMDLEGVVSTANMPDTVGGIVSLLRELKVRGLNEAILERVGGYIAGTPTPGSFMFRFGESYGVIQGCLAALGFRYELVLPQKWQKPLALGTRGSAGGSSEWKRRLKSEAERRFPNLDVTLKTADALLILDYAIAQNK